MSSIYSEKGKGGFYGVRKGRHGLQSCVFMYWHDCKGFVEGYEEAEFRIFGELEDAVEYVMMIKENNNSVHSSESSEAESKNHSSDDDNDDDDEEEIPLLSKEAMERYYAERGLERPTPMLPPFEGIKIKGDPDSKIHNNNSINNLTPDEMYSQKNNNNISRVEEIDKDDSEDSEEEEEELLQGSDNDDGNRTTTNVDDESVGFKRKAESSNNDEMMNIAKTCRYSSSTDKFVRSDGRENKAWELNIQKAQEFLYLERMKLEDDKRSIICSRPNHVKDKKISSWLQRQVVSFKKGTLKLSRQERLMNDLEWDIQKAVDFCTCYIFEEDWQQMYGKLCEFYSNHGHSNVSPTEHSDLSKWVSRQKEEYKKLRSTNKPSKLDLHKIQKLNHVQFPFPKNKGKKYKWVERLEQLKSYKELHGNLKIPRFYDTPQFPGLGDWVDTQRYYYDKFFHSPHNFKNANRIPQQQRERLKKLEQIGLEFTPLNERRPVSKWADMLELLRKYKRKHGHLMVPQKEPLLGQWVKGQRKQYNYLRAGKPSNMTEEKVSELNEIGFEFDGKKRTKDFRKVENITITTTKKEVDLTNDILSGNESHDESDDCSTNFE